jgi:hypothetical protein
VFVSKDGGLRRSPLIGESTDRTFRFNAPRSLIAGDVRLKVLASDGGIARAT